ncbi:MAG: hypothetical protein LH613_12805 [Chamaesiphon sp.]|nr:hypothetical protein [Chamaesiphon sp.]
MQTIQLTAQVDDDGMLRVQMPEDLKNTTVEATIVFTATSDRPVAWSDRSKSPSPLNLTPEEQIVWSEIVHSLAGAWSEDFPSLTEIRSGFVDAEREIL